METCPFLFHSWEQIAQTCMGRPLYWMSHYWVCPNYSPEAFMGPQTELTLIRPVTPTALALVLLFFPHYPAQHACLERLD